MHLSAEETVDFAADLAQRRAGALVDAGRYEEAIAVYDEEARGYRALLSGATGMAPDPHTARRQGLHLSKVLMEIGSLQARLRRSEPALATTAEALAIARGLGPADPGLGQYVVSRVLWGYAWVRAGLGVELGQALQAVQEAEGLLHALAQDPPQALAQAVSSDLSVVQAFHAHLRGRWSAGDQR